MQDGRGVSSTGAELCAMSESFPIVRGLKLLLEYISGEYFNIIVLTDSQSAIVNIVRPSDKSFRTNFFGTKAFRIHQEVKKQCGSESHKYT